MKMKDLAKEVGRSVPSVMLIQKKYGLSVFKNYAPGYVVMLKKVIYLSILSVTVTDVKALLKSETRLLELLKVDSLNESPDWYEALCSMKAGRSRLLISGYDIGMAVAGNAVQFGLDFKERAKELFEDSEMGADALQGLRRYAQVVGKVRPHIAGEVGLVRDAAKWCRRGI